MRYISGKTSKFQKKIRMDYHKIQFLFAIIIYVNGNTNSGVHECRSTKEPKMIKPKSDKIYLDNEVSK